MRGENRSTRRKTSRSRVENQQQTQPTYDAGSGNRTRDTLVGGERSHHCANPAPLDVKKITSLTHLSRLEMKTATTSLRTARIFTLEKQNVEKTEHFKSITSNCHASAIADHVTSTGHNLKWDHFDILAKGRSDTHCKIKETLFIRDLKPALNENVGSEKLLLY